MRASAAVQLFYLALLAAAITPAQAMELRTAVERAIAIDDQRRALDSSRRAAEANAVADGALPDPEIMIGASGVPINDPLGADGMTQYRIGMRQRFPAGDSRSLARERGESRAETLGARGAARDLEVTHEVRQAWLAWVEANQALELTIDSLETFEELVELTEARYRSGSGRQSDVEQARLELARLERRILDAERQRDLAASELARWTGQQPVASPSPDLPDWPAPPEDRSIEAQLAAHPVIAADDSSIATGRIEHELARQAYRPSWALEGGYARQRGPSPSGGRMSDKFFAQVSLSLPLFPARRQDRRVDAARAEVDALEHQRSDRLREWRGQADAARVSYQRERERLGLIDASLLPQAERTVDATLAAFRTDRADFDELIRARLALLDERIERVATESALLKARARLAWLTAEEIS